jgi:sarcosine oxidase subunit alpha
VVATGSYENPMVFENNDLPGIFLAGGLQRLMHRDFVRPGNTAVVVTHNDRGYMLAHQLMDAGVNVAAIADKRAAEQALDANGAQRAKDAGIRIYPHFDIDAALGRRQIKGVRLRPTDGSNRPKLLLECDVLGIAGSRVPANELVFQRTSQGQYLLESPNQFTRKPVISEHMRIETDMHVAGGASGSRHPRQSWLEGKVAGLSAALDLGYGNGEVERARNEAEALLDDL